MSVDLFINIEFISIDIIAIALTILNCHRI